MLLSLNEHCLLHLCDFLSIEDQLVLSRVCEFFRDFFEHNFWKWKCKRISLIKSFWDEKENAEYIPKLIRIAAPVLEEFALECIHIDEYQKLLLALKFSKMKVCRFHSIDGAQLRIIAQIFPNLKVLSIKGKISEFISHLKQLETLRIEVYFLTNAITNHIFNLPNLKQIYFIDSSKVNFQQTLQMAHFSKTLEEIGFNEPYLHKGVVNSLKKITKLRTINLWPTDEFFDITYNINKIEKHFEYAIDTLLYGQLKFSSTGAEEICKLQHLRCIILYKTLFQSDELEQLCHNMPPTLAEFYYLYCSQGEIVEESANKFLPLMNKCPNLQLLDVSGNYITENFVADIAKEMSIQNCQQTLVLCCFQTKITKKGLQDLSLPDNLQVSLLKQKYSFKISNSKHFQIQLDQTKIKEGVEEDEEEVDDDDDYYYDNQDYNYDSDDSNYYNDDSNYYNDELEWYRNFPYRINSYSYYY